MTTIIRASKEKQIKNSLLYLLPLIARNLLPLLGLGIFTRILTAQEYGALALAQVYAVFVGGLANMGMTTAYNRNFYQYRNDPLKSAQLLYSTLCFISFNFLIVSSATYFIKDSLSEMITGSAIYGGIFFWAVCAQFFTNASHQYFLVYIRNSENAKEFVVYTVVGTIFTFLFSLLFVAYLRVGPVGLVFGQLCSGIIICLLLFSRFIVTLAPSLNKEVFIEALKIAYPITPRIFFGVLGTHFDKYMVGLIASVGGVGIYSIGQKIANLVFTFMTSLQNVFAPQVYQRMFDLKEEGGEVIGRYLTPFAYVSILFALGVSLFSQEVITLLTPPSYHGAIDIVAILSMYYGLLFFGKITGPQLIYMKKMFLSSSLTLVRIGINVGLNIPFIMKWGALGAAWATLLSGFIMGSISFAIAQHYYKISWKIRELAYIYFTFFGFSFLVILLKNLSAPYGISLAVKLLAVTVYCLVGIRVKVITGENYRLVREIVSSLLRVRLKAAA